MPGSAAKIARLLFVLLSVVLLGMWVNIYTDRLKGGNYVSTVVDLGWTNILLAGGSTCLAASEYAAQRRRVMEQRDLERHLDTLRQHQRRLLQNTLTLVCELISRTLRVPCNARYFVVLPDNDGEYYLEQDRELAVLNLRMPRECGFTRISVNTPHIVTGRAFTERRPVYEDLPLNHHDRYQAPIARMIEPAQRWVLACPVLALDPKTNRHDDVHPPHGVICFYSTTAPPTTAKEPRVADCLRYAELFADQMSQLLNILELTQDMAKPNDQEAESVS